MAPVKSKKERIDLLVVERGLAESRIRAQALILAGQVVADEKRIDKPGTLSRQQTADVLAYMLSLSKTPPGTTPLPADAGALAQITYRSYPPQP